MDNEKTKPQLGEMISNFPVEELKRAIMHIDRFDTDVVTDQKIQAVEVERKLEEKSEEIIVDNL